MPLFGPNIKKMKEKREIEGLIKALDNPSVCAEAAKALAELKHIEKPIEALNSNNAIVRIEIAEALKTVNDPQGFDGLNKSLIKALRFGEIEEQVEAITIIQGRAPKNILSFAIPGERERVEALEKSSGKLSLETFRDALLEVAKQRKSAFNVWYALVALVELGDRSDEVLRELIEFSDSWFRTLDNMREGTQALFAFFIGRAVQEETLRALSFFRGSSIAASAITNAFEEKILSSSHITIEKKNTIYALAALGDFSTKERLEYLVAKDRAPRIALELYGRATYDEIKEKVEGARSPLPTVQPQTVPPGPPCPSCSGQLTWIAQYQRWYCYKEGKYA